MGILAEKIMKKILAVVGLIVGLSGCVGEDTYYDEPAYPPGGHYMYGTVEYCNSEGMCRTMDNVNYFYDSNGAVVYYDVAFGCWIGYAGFWGPYGWHRGWPVGWHAGYGWHRGGEWHGGGWHGSYHGGGAVHGGGHRR